MQIKLMKDVGLEVDDCSRVHSVQVSGVTVKLISKRLLL